jgi:hypothetical protein
MGYNCSIIVLVFSTSIFMTWGTTVLLLYLYFPHQSWWHGVQRFYHCTCIFHINLYNMGYNCSNLYDMGYNGSNLYHMGYNSSIIVLVFSTSIFMTWGTTFYHCTCIFHIKLYDMGYNGSIIVLVFSTSNFMTWGTTVLSLYLYFPHQSLWHGMQQFCHCTGIFHINLYDMGYNSSIIVLVFSTSIFMTWGTTVLSLYLYFPHQSLWHGVQRFYHCTCIFHTTWQFNSLQVFQKIHWAINGGEIHRDI